MSDSESKKDTNTEDRLLLLEKNIDSILHRVRNASVLNGGFDSIRKEIKEIKEAQVRMEYEVKFLVETDAKYQKRISDITELIYDPDDGIYKRIANATTGDAELNKRLSALEAKLISIEGHLIEASKISESMKKIAGEDLEALKSLVGAKNTVNKLFIVLVTAVAASVGGFLWNVIERLLK